MSHQRKSALKYILPTVLLVIFCLGLWANTGTLAPYAVSHHTPTVLPACEYLVNLDNEHFLATYRFMKGADPATWQWSVVLRRVLFPLFSYPFMEAFGFLIGGVVASFILQIAAYLFFVAFVWKRVGRQGGLTAAALLSTYPGTFYWSGLPYSYVMIVPCCLFGFMLLTFLSEAKRLSTIGLFALMLGILFTGYDLLPYFGFAALITLCIRRRFIAVPIALCAMVAPTILVVLFFKYFFEIDPSNVNSNIYGQIIGAYLNVSDWTAWWSFLKVLPGVFVHNFVYSNFVFLPVMFLLAVLVGKTVLKVKFSLVELSLLFAVASVFLFNNAAPAYPGQWQLRGDWIARLYQPIFVVLLFYIARVCQCVLGGACERKGIRRGVLSVLFVGFIGNSLIAFGPFIAPVVASYTYYEFYQHSRPTALVENIEKFGRRPLGMCRGAEKKRKRKGRRRKKRKVS